MRNNAIAVVFGRLYGRHPHKMKYAFLRAWHTKSVELLRGEFILGISFAYDRDIFNHQHLRVGFLKWTLYLEWEY